jgi:hypothetical protein
MSQFFTFGEKSRILGTSGNFLGKVLHSRNERLSNDQKDASALKIQVLLCFYVLYGCVVFLENVKSSQKIY